MVWHPGFQDFNLRTRSESAFVKSAHENMKKHGASKPGQAAAGSQFGPPINPESPENGVDDPKTEPVKAAGDLSSEVHADPNGADSERPETGSPSLGYTADSRPQASTDLGTMDFAAA